LTSKSTVQFVLCHYQHKSHIEVFEEVQGNFCVQCISSSICSSHSHINIHPDTWMYQYRPLTFGKTLIAKQFKRHFK